MNYQEYFSLYLSTVGWALAVALAFYIPERFAPAEKGQPTANRVANLVYTPVVVAIIFLIQPLFNPVFNFAFTSSGGGLLWAVISRPSGVMGQVIFAIAFAVVWDVWQYWVHRLQHNSSYLWQTHRFHHSDTALNATSQARHHALNNIPALIGYLPVLVLFGSQQPHFIVTFLMFRLWGFVNHANLRISFGPFTPLIAGPQWHRIHHSIESQHLNQNFATFFPFIDKMFGTYYKPQKNEYPATGLLDGQSLLREATVEPFYGLVSLARAQLRIVRPGRRAERGVGETEV
jgi:sterol desaturase/sphingolipid hydroxylase (fatty acid hydroxylase superfamily)